MTDDPMWLGSSATLGFVSIGTWNRFLFLGLSFFRLLGCVVLCWLCLVGWRILRLIGLGRLLRFRLRLCRRRLRLRGVGLWRRLGRGLCGWTRLVRGILLLRRGAGPSVQQHRYRECARAKHRELDATKKKLPQGVPGLKSITASRLQAVLQQRIEVYRRTIPLTDTCKPAPGIHGWAAASVGCGCGWVATGKRKRKVVPEPGIDSKSTEP